MTVLEKCCGAHRGNIETLSTDLNVNSLFWISCCRPLNQSKKDGYRCEITIDPDNVSLFNSRGERDDENFLEN